MGKICSGCRRYKEENERLTVQVNGLREELAYVKFELEELKGKRYKSGRKKVCGQEENKAMPRKRGGVFGHMGWFRKKPERIDRVEEVRLEECPECGGKQLKEYEEIDEHTQEDIVLPKAESVLYRKHMYYCPRCQKTVVGKGDGELPGSYIGPKAKALAMFLKYMIKISDRDIKKIFEKGLNLRFVPSSITGFGEQVKREGRVIYEELIKWLKGSRFIHIDETGWKMDGLSWWLWKYSTKKVCVTHIDESRGQKVVEKILGKKYEGILISDFLSAYNKILAKGKQRCLVHILRDLKKVVEYWYDDRQVLGYCKHLKDIFEDAIELHKEYKEKRWDERFYRKRELLTQELGDFIFPNPNKKILKRFAKRLYRHKDELLTFLYQKDIDYHNNHAEQQIRPDVIYRKITFGSRSYRGAENHSVIMSILQTAKLNGLDPIKTLQDIIQHPKKNPFAMALAPPLKENLLTQVYSDTGKLSTVA